MRRVSQLTSMLMMMSSINAMDEATSYSLTDFETDLNTALQAHPISTASENIRKMITSYVYRPHLFESTRSPGSLEHAAGKVVARELVKRTYDYLTNLLLYDDFVTDVKKKSGIKRKRYGAPVGYLAATSHDKKIAALTFAHKPSEVDIVTLHTGELIQTLTFGHHTQHIHFGTDDAHLIVSDGQRWVTTFDLQQKNITNVITPPFRQNSLVAYCTKKNLVALQTNEHHIGLFNTQTGECVKYLRKKEKPLASLNFLETENLTLLAACNTNSNSIHVWREKDSLTLSGHKYYCHDFASDTSILQLASASCDNTIGVWDTTTGKKIHKLVHHSDDVFTIDMTDDGRHLISGSADTHVKLWDTRQKRCIKTLTQHKSVLNKTSWGENEWYCYSNDTQGNLYAWDVRNLQLLRNITHLMKA